MTINTLWYVLIWAFMMLIGGACYEQRIIQKYKGKKYEALAFTGQAIMFIAMVGFVHGVLTIIDLGFLKLPK